MQHFKTRHLISKLLLVGGILLSPFAQASEKQPLFWSVESEQGHSGYLLGTIHSEDPRVLEYTEDFLSALSGSSQFAMELVPNLPTLAKLMEVMQLSGSETLADRIGEERFESVAQAMATYGIPRAQAERMKPWAAMVTLSVPAPKTGFFMDFSLSLRASGSGVKVVGLETLDEQLGFMENMPMEHQLSMLDQAVRETHLAQEVHDQMVEIYLKQDLNALLDETERQLSELDEAARDYFIEEGIDARNHRMLKTLLGAMDEGTVFTAVGALHLPGPDGLIALLRENGYRLAPMPSPFPSTQ